MPIFFAGALAGLAAGVILGWMIGVATAADRGRAAGHRPCEVCRWERERARSESDEW